MVREGSFNSCVSFLKISIELEIAAVSELIFEMSAFSQNWVLPPRKCWFEGTE